MEQPLHLSYHHGAHVRVLGDWEEKGGVCGGDTRCEDTANYMFDLHPLTSHLPPPHTPHPHTLHLSSPLTPILPHPLTTHPVLGGRVMYEKPPSHPGHQSCSPAWTGETAPALDIAQEGQTHGLNKGGRRQKTADGGMVHWVELQQGQYTYEVRASQLAQAWEMGSSRIPASKQG